MRVLFRVEHIIAAYNWSIFLFPRIKILNLNQNHFACIRVAPLNCEMAKWIKLDLNLNCIPLVGLALQWTWLGTLQLLARKVLQLEWCPMQQMKCVTTKRYHVTEAFFVYGKGVATQIPYRNLNYKALKFAMVLSSLDIQELNVPRRSLVFMLQGISWLNSSSIECRTRWRSCNLVVAGSHLSQRALFSLLQCCFQAYSSWGSKC